MLKLRSLISVPLLVATLTVVSPAGAASRGGTYRVGLESIFSQSDAFDPTGEYDTSSWAIYSSLLVRTLMGYEHRAGVAGNRLVPDLAAALPQMSNDGKRYTFQLRTGVRFAPPVAREVTSSDVAYALRRLAKPANGGQYAFYYSVIRGWDAFAGGHARSIAGVTTPDAHTIVFDLTEPTADFPYRLSLPATGPIPAEVARCFTGKKANRYGRNLVSSGPYMFAGSDQVDTSSCQVLRPASGYDGRRVMTLVRNPQYDPATDTAAARENLPDSFVFRVYAKAADIFRRVAAGQLDDEEAVPTRALIERYLGRPSLRPRLQVDHSDVTLFLTMNLTQPPFDDVHVRRAMNWAMDKHRLREAIGGPTAATISGHIAPDALLGDPARRDPFKTPGARGSLRRARGEMRRSRYDSDGDGRCDARVCRDVLMVAEARPSDQQMVKSIRAAARRLGIRLRVRSMDGSFNFFGTPANNVAMTESAGWGKDYADPITYFQPLFDSSSILPRGNFNFSLVGLTPAIAKRVGARGRIASVPSVDGQIARCSKLLGGPRLRCFTALDDTLMTHVVPWIPYLVLKTVTITGPKVTQWAYDQFSGSTAYAHVAVR